MTQTLTAQSTVLSKYSQRRQDGKMAFLCVTVPFHSVFSLSVRIPQESEQHSWDSLRVQTSQARTRGQRGQTYLRSQSKPVGQP